MNSFICNVAGLFAGADQTEPPRRDDVVPLVHEPNNPYDAGAVRVDGRFGEKLGYIPRSHNPMIHAAVAEGLEPQATIIETGFGRGGVGKPTLVCLRVDFLTPRPIAEIPPEVENAYDTLNES